MFLITTLFAFLITTFFLLEREKKNLIKSKKKSKDPLGDMFKNHENEFEQRIPGHIGIMFRMDGRAFSKFTKQLPRTDGPFNPQFRQAMLCTGNAAAQEFHAACMFVMSDEISLWIPPKCTKYEYDNWDDPKRQRPEHLSNGRVEKLTTVIAGFCTGQFILHFTQAIMDEHGFDNYSFERICKATFDARAFTLENIPIHKYFWWRSAKDGYRNTISAFARTLYSNTQLHKKSNSDMIVMMGDGKDAIDWKQVPDYLKYGIFGKKEIVDTLFLNTKTGQYDKCKRSHIINFTMLIPEAASNPDTYYDFFSSKYLLDTLPITKYY